MASVVVGRSVALVTSGLTVAFFFLSDSLTRDNLFLVPDLIICALLIVAALVPGMWAPGALALALALTAGVFVCATAEHIQLGESWAVTAAGTLVTAGMAMYLMFGRPVTAAKKPRISSATSHTL